MTPAASRQPGSTAPVAQSGHRVAIVADCDHQSIDIEQAVLASTCGPNCPGSPAGPRTK